MVYERGGLTMNLQEEILKIKNEMIDEFDKRVEALKVDEQEFPQFGDDYWYVDSDTDVMDIAWYDGEYDQGRLSIGNVFKIKEEAEFAAEKLKVEAELRKFSRPFELDSLNHYIFLDTDDDCLGVDSLSFCQSQGTIHFESEEKAQQAIDAVGEQRIKKYIFGVE